MEKTELGESVKKIIKELVGKMGFESEVEIEETEDSWLCNIKTEESSFLIGQYGVNLQSLQHIARAIIRKKTDEKINFSLDVNYYRREKNDSIIKMAENLATQSLMEKRAIVLRPMSPYERRIVHMELSKNDQIKTESIGEGEDRRVVIKPRDLIS